MPINDRPFPTGYGSKPNPATYGEKKYIPPATKYSFTRPNGEVVSRTAGPCGVPVWYDSTHGLIRSHSEPDQIITVSAAVLVAPLSTGDSPWQDGLGYHTV